MSKFYYSISFYADVPSGIYDNYNEACREEAVSLREHILNGYERLNPEILTVEVQGD